MQIDKFGKFAYVLVKLSDRLAGSKLFVRGKNGRSEQQLVSAVSKEVRHALCFAFSFCQPEPAYWMQINAGSVRMQACAFACT